MFDKSSFKGYCTHCESVEDRLKNRFDVDLLVAKYLQSQSSIEARRILNKVLELSPEIKNNINASSDQIIQYNYDIPKQLDNTYKVKERSFVLNN